MKLLSGFAPEVFAEILEYDCRLMNEATRAGRALSYRDLMVASDAGRSLHAAIITPDASHRIARRIVAEPTDFLRTRAAGTEACTIIRETLAAGLTVQDREMIWLDRIERELEDWASEDELIAEMSEEFDDVSNPEEYGLVEAV